MNGETKLAVFTLPELERMGETFVKSGLWGFKEPSQVVALLLKAQAEGRHPASALDDYDIIQGKPALKSKAALARFQRAGGCIQWIERTPARVSARFFHPQGGELIVTWDDARVKEMGLDGRDSHKKQPMIMKQWRVVAEGVRAVFPACLGDLYLVEEVEDFEPRQERNITPQDRPAIQEPEATGPKPEPDDNATIDGKQAEYFWHVARAKRPDGSPGWSDAQIRAYLEDEAKLDSTKSMRLKDLPKHMEWAGRELTAKEKKEAVKP